MVVCFLYMNIANHHYFQATDHADKTRWHVPYTFEDSHYYTESLNSHTSNTRHIIISFLPRLLLIRLLLRILLRILFPAVHW